MKFKSYDTVQQCDCVSEIHSAESQTVHMYIQTWVPDYMIRLLRNPKFGYSLFQWDDIIKLSLNDNTPWECYCCLTADRIDGLLCLNMESLCKIEYIATAPWNYHTIGKMRTIGSGLICFVITKSINSGFEGEFILNALPDAEQFYKKIGMVETGKIKNGLKEFFISKKNALNFNNKFKKFIL